MNPQSARDIEGKVYKIGSKVYTCGKPNKDSRYETLIKCTVIGFSRTGESAHLEVVGTGNRIYKRCEKVVGV
jgi:hypothetical protein